MSPLEMIAEWRKGCSCGSVEHPEQCEQCTAGLIDALGSNLMKNALITAQVTLDKAIELAVAKFQTDTGLLVEEVCLTNHYTFGKLDLGDAVVSTKIRGSR